MKVSLLDEDWSYKPLELGILGIVIETYNLTCVDFWRAPHLMHLLHQVSLLLRVMETKNGDLRKTLVHASLTFLGKSHKRSLKHFQAR